MVACLNGVHGAPAHLPALVERKYEQKPAQILHLHMGEMTVQGVQVTVCHVIQTVVGFK